MPPPILVLTFSNQRGNSSTRRTGSQVSAGAMLTCCSSCKVKVTVKKVRNKRKVKYNAQDYWLEICQIHPWKSSLLIIVKCWKYKASQGHHEYSRSKIANKKTRSTLSLCYVSDAKFCTYPTVKLLVHVKNIMVIWSIFDNEKDFCKTMNDMLKLFLIYNPGCSNCPVIITCDVNRRIMTMGSAVMAVLLSTKWYRIKVPVDLCCNNSNLETEGHGILRVDINGLVQEKRNSSALAMELSFSCTKPSIYSIYHMCHQNPPEVTLTLNMLNCFKDYKRYIYILNCIFDFGLSQADESIFGTTKHVVCPTQPISCLPMQWRL